MPEVPDPPPPSAPPPKTVIVAREENNLASPSEGLVEVVEMPWWKVILIRGGRVYVQSLLGFLTAAESGAAGALGVQLPAHDFLHLFGACAGLALAPACYTILQNTIEILTKLDVSAPQLRA